VYSLRSECANHTWGISETCRSVLVDPNCTSAVEPAPAISSPYWRNARAGAAAAAPGSANEGKAEARASIEAALVPLVKLSQRCSITTAASYTRAPVSKCRSCRLGVAVHAPAHHDQTRRAKEPSASWPWLSAVVRHCSFSTAPLARNDGGVPAANQSSEPMKRSLEPGAPVSRSSIRPFGLKSAWINSKQLRSIFAPVGTSDAFSGSTLQSQISFPN